MKVIQRSEHSIEPMEPSTRVSIENLILLVLRRKRLFAIAAIVSVAAAVTAIFKYLKVRAEKALPSTKIDKDSIVAGRDAHVIKNSFNQGGSNSDGRGR